jgi:hypothetical protein
VLASAERALAIDPDSSLPTAKPVSANTFLDRFGAARRALQRAGPLLDPPTLALGYYIAMLEQDMAAMDLFAARIKESPQPYLLQHAQSLAAARTGQLGARGLSREKRSMPPEDLASAKPRQPLDPRPPCGRRSRETNRRPDSARSPRWEISTGRDVMYAGGFALALAGDITRSEALANDLERHYPRDTLVRFTYVPTLRALAALARNQPAMAIELLQANVPYERACPATAFNLFFGSLYPVYVRGQAYAASEQHQQAAASFRRSSTIRD